MTGSTTEPERLTRLATAAYPSFALLAGMQLDVFAPLKDGPMSVEEIAGAIGVSAVKLDPLLCALVAAGLLTVNEDIFSNTPEADEFLVRDSPSYLGDHVYVNRLLMWWGFSAALKTAESILTGIPQEKYDFSARSEQQMERDLRSTLPVAARAGRELAARYDFSSHRTLLDVGGGPGGLAIAVTEACPHLRATVVDLPTVAPIAQRLVEEAGAADRVEVTTADVVEGPLRGSFDVAVLRALVQVLSPDEAHRAVKNVSEAINPGGVMYILGHVLDSSRISPLEEVWHRMVSVSFYDVPPPYTELEFKNWMTEAGLEQVERATLPNGDGVMRARKPA